MTIEKKDKLIKTERTITKILKNLDKLVEWTHRTALSNDPIEEYQKQNFNTLYRFVNICKVNLSMMRRLIDNTVRLFEVQREQQEKGKLPLANTQEVKLKKWLIDELTRFSINGTIDRYFEDQQKMSYENLAKSVQSLDCIKPIYILYVEYLANIHSKDLIPFLQLSEKKRLEKLATFNLHIQQRFYDNLKKHKEKSKAK